VANLAQKASDRPVNTFTLTFEEREKVRTWIKSLVPGAAVPECGGCGIVPERAPGDAGVADAADQ